MYHASDGPTVRLAHAHAPRIDTSTDPADLLRRVATELRILAIAGHDVQRLVGDAIAAHAEFDVTGIQTLDRATQMAEALAAFVAQLADDLPLTDGMDAGRALATVFLGDMRYRLSGGVAGDIYGSSSGTGEVDLL